MPNHPPKPQPFISLSQKIQFLFLAVFTPVYIFTYYWYYDYAVQNTTRLLTNEIAHVAEAAVKDIDVENFVKLYEEESEKNINCPPSPYITNDATGNGYYPENNPHFEAHMQWLERVVLYHPDMSIYTYVKGPREDTVIIISSSWYFVKKEESFKFCQQYDAAEFNNDGTSNMPKGLIKRTDIWEPYTDEYGEWVSTYMPIKDKNGNIVGALGVDISAAKITKIKWDMGIAALVTFLITYGVLLWITFNLNKTISKPISNLSAVAKQIGENKQADFSSIKDGRSNITDEIDNLTDSMQTMATKLSKQNEELTSSHEQMQELTRSLLREQENERKRISRELHNEAGQLLVRLKNSLADMILELASRKKAQTNERSVYASLKKRLKLAVEEVENTIGTVRMISRHMRPAILDVGGIDLALRSYCEEFETIGKIKITCACEGQVSLSEETAISLYRFLQEALTNSVKHSNATQAHVVMSVQDNWVSVSVADNGKERRKNNKSNGIGILGIKERFSILGGRVETSSTSKGFTITACAPIEPISPPA